MADPFRSLAWDDLRLVKAIADTRSLPAAAGQLGINHSTVFRRLRQVEETFGGPLFERHRTGYVPTSVGEDVVALAGRIDADVTDVTRRLAGREPAPAGELRVTTNDTLLIHLLTPLFARFGEAYPQVRLDIVLDNMALNLSRRDADVAIRATDTPSETLVGRRVARIAWALYGRAADFPAPGDVALDVLAQQRWVSLGENLGSLKVVKFVEARVAPQHIVYRLNTVLGLAEAVEAGIGIGHIPCFVADTRPLLTRLRPPEPAFSADLWLLTHPDLRHAPRVRALLDFLAQEFGRQRRLIEGTSRDQGEPAGKR